MTAYPILILISAKIYTIQLWLYRHLLARALKWTVARLSRVLDSTGLTAMKIPITLSTIWYTLFYFLPKSLSMLGHLATAPSKDNEAFKKPNVAYPV